MKTLALIFLIASLILFFYLGMMYRNLELHAASLTSFLNTKQFLLDGKYQDAIISIFSDSPESDSSWMKAEFLGDTFICLKENKSASIWYAIAQQLIIKSGSQASSIIDIKVGMASHDNLSINEEKIYSSMCRAKG
jgi:hypothetical protein